MGRRDPAGCWSPGACSRGWRASRRARRGIAGPRAARRAGRTTSADRRARGAWRHAREPPVRAPRAPAAALPGSTGTRSAGRSGCRSASRRRSRTSGRAAGAAWVIRRWSTRSRPFRQRPRDGRTSAGPASSSRIQPHRSPGADRRPGRHRRGCDRGSVRPSLVRWHSSGCAEGWVEGMQTNRRRSAMPSTRAGARRARGHGSESARGAERSPHHAGVSH